MFKKRRVQSKIYIGSIFEMDIKELDPSEACKVFRHRKEPKHTDKN